MHGDLEGAEVRARGLVEKVPQMHTVVLMREVLGLIALARGDGREAEAQGRELEAMAQKTTSARHRALAEFMLGCAAMLEGNTDRARHLLQSALVVYAELGLERGATEVLDELALMAADGGDVKRAARLAAAAAAARARLHCVPMKSIACRFEAARAKVVDSDSRAAWDGAWAEGEALSLAEAIAYACRARGPRDRPVAGWGKSYPGRAPGRSAGRRRDDQSPDRLAVVHVAKHSQDAPVECVREAPSGQPHRARPGDGGPVGSQRHGRLAPTSCLDG